MMNGRWVAFESSELHKIWIQWNPAIPDTLEPKKKSALISEVSSCQGMEWRLSTIQLSLKPSLLSWGQG